MRSFLYLFLFLTLVSCGMNMGDRIDAENLSVYYTEGVSKNQAINFTKFWRSNGFVGEKPQTIQLEKDKADWILVKVIENKSFENQKLTIQEMALLNDLERQLSSEIFQTRVEIIITDNTFRPLDKGVN